MCLQRSIRLAVNDFNAARDIWQVPTPPLPSPFSLLNCIQSSSSNTQPYYDGFYLAQCYSIIFGHSTQNKYDAIVMCEPFFFRRQQSPVELLQQSPQMLIYSSSTCRTRHMVPSAITEQSFWQHPPLNLSIEKMRQCSA